MCHQISLFFPRYPVILLRFHLNPGTGGDGFFRGGDGVIRELVFRRTQVLSVLTERRSAFRPYGVQGKSHQGTKLVISRDEGPCFLMFQPHCILTEAKFPRYTSCHFTDVSETDRATLWPRAIL